ncbi:MAG: PKD domain-containing protein, partial [Acidimicrobiales bacterium]
LQQRLNLVKAADPTVSCTGDLGVNSGCYVRGLFFVLSGAGTMGSGHEAYIRQQLGADQSTWRICSWHKNQAAMQIGGKSDAVGWGPYEACRELGAIIATAHEHSYERTKTLTNTQTQTVDPAWPARDNLRVAPGASFVFVSGLGGNSVRDQERCLPATYPYGCKGEWAFVYTSSQNARFGALFIEFNVDGDPRKARGYFKNVSGVVVDQFDITSQLTTPDAAPPVVAAPIVDPGSEGQPLNLTATFTDSDEDAPYPATINWGDGSSTAGTVTPTAGGGTVSGTHAYADNGAFTVTVSVSDGDGGTGENSGTATVSNVTPTATAAGGPYTGVEGSAITFTGSATDPGSADVLTYEWDFHYDGLTFEVEGSGTAATRTYTYTQDAPTPYTAA